MVLSSTSLSAVRFLALVSTGESLRSAARSAGVHPETGYRFLRDRYLELRRTGVQASAVGASLGFHSNRFDQWEQLVPADGRHHLRVEATREARFWEAFDSGGTLATAADAASVSRATGYRWVARRFDDLREHDSLRSVTAALRLPLERARELEQERRRRARNTANAATAARREALQRSATLSTSPPLSASAHRRRVREDRYWQLIRGGTSNAEACRILGMSARSGSHLRRRHPTRIPPSHLTKPPGSGRYLDLRERLQIADLIALGYSIRTVAIQLGRHPSTVSRELHRHRNEHGSYLPRTADHDARRGRTRPKTLRLDANPRLRALIQRKLNRHWSPDEISGWLRKTYPADTSMRISHETIYQALLLRDDNVLHHRYSSKLRTGRRVRKTRWRHRIGRGSRIRNMVMIDQRPAEIETKTAAGHWEGDLILGPGAASAMVTLRERKTHYGLVVNLPHDHTAATVNAAIINALAALPATMKQSLTWDQGVEMAAHEALTAATGMPVYFAERSSPWQRGANENFNGLLRQYFPKGTNLAVHSPEHVTKVAAELNARPRRTLDYDTPAARLRAELLHARKTPKDAIRDDGAGVPR